MVPSYEWFILEASCGSCLRCQDGEAFPFLPSHIHASVALPPPGFEKEQRSQIGKDRVEKHGRLDGWRCFPLLPTSCSSLFPSSSLNLGSMRNSGWCTTHLEEASLSPLPQARGGSQYQISVLVNQYFPPFTSRFQPFCCCDLYSGDLSSNPSSTVGRSTYFK